MINPSRTATPLITGLLLAILIAVTALGPLALNIFIPSMPGLPAVFATDYATIQLALTLYLVATSLSHLLLGPLSDRYGRRPVILAGLGLFTVGSLTAAAATSVELLLVGRMLQAVGGSCGVVLGRAVIRDCYEDRDVAASVIAYVTMAMAVAPMLAPALGGYLDVWFGWRASFILVSVLGLLTLAAAAPHLPETIAAKSTSFNLASMRRDFSHLLRSTTFRCYTLVLAFSASVFFAFLAAAPYLMIEVLDRSPGEYGLYFMAISLAYISGNFFAARLVRRLGIIALVNAGCTLLLFSAAVMIGCAGFAPLSPLTLFGPMFGVALANGMLLPSATAAAVSALPAISGAASGLSGFLQMLFGALATWLIGHLQGDSPWPMVIVMASSSVLCALSFWLRRQSQH